MASVLLIGSGAGADVATESTEDIAVNWSKIREKLSEAKSELKYLLDDGQDSLLQSIAFEFGVSATGELGIIVSKASVTVGTKVTLTLERTRSS
ncbi:MAG TPA: hypothetical protein VF763_03510 [Candidatus Limnocylindrales bacterium]